jgi:hypothetical protein
MLLACDPATASIGPPASQASDAAYSLCPPGRELPPKDVNDRAVAILGGRLASLGIEESSIEVGECINVTAVPADAALEPSVRAAVLGTGVVEIVPIPADRVGYVLAGSARPVGAQALAGGGDILGSRTEPTPAGGTILWLELAGSAATGIESWAVLHQGEGLAMVVDGVVVAVMPVYGPLGGELPIELAKHGFIPVPLDAVEAMIATGPLPPEWAQPQLPQG